MIIYRHPRAANVCKNRCQSDMVGGRGNTWCIYPAWVHRRKVNNWVGFGPMLCQHHLLSLRKTTDGYTQCLKTEIAFHTDTFSG